MVNSHYYNIILDIDECQEKRCGKNATCTNTEGSFRCTCNIGYYGDGYNCTGIPLLVQTSQDKAVASEGKRQQWLIIIRKTAWNIIMFTGLRMPIVSGKKNG